MRRLVALTNGSLDQSVAMAFAAGLRWHCLLVGDAVRTFKPNPAAYRLPLELVGLDPTRTAFVAAHPWDLRGAAEHGYRTVYVARPGADPAEPGAFDAHVADLAELADLLAG